MKYKYKRLALLGTSFFALGGITSTTLVGCTGKITPKEDETPKETKVVAKVTYEDTATGVKVTGISNPGEKIQVIEIPDKFEGKTVESIDEGALRGCPNLEKVSLPFIGKSKDAKGKEALFGWVFGSNMYDGCGGFTWQEYDDVSANGLETVYASYCIPTSLVNVEITNPTQVAAGSFSNCKYLESINISKSNIETIGNKAFLGCNGMMNFDIGFANGLKHIEHGAFAKCLTLQYIELPDTLNSIGASAFEGCVSCTRANIPTATTSVGPRSFYSVPGIVMVEANEAQTKLPTWDKDWITLSTPVIYDFTKESSVGYTSEWTAIICGSSENKYAYLAQWMGNYQQTSVIIPSEVSINGITYPVKFIGAKCFQQNIYVQNVTFQEGIVDIQPKTFEDCVSLEYVTFPSTLKTIRANAFSGCTKLIGHVENSTKIETIDLVNVEEIGDNAFTNCSSIINVIFNKVKHIGNEAFAYCTHLCPDSTENEDNCLLIPSSCETIGERAFKFCFKYAPDSVSISPYYPTIKLGENSNLKVIPKSCFEDCGVRIQKPTSGEDKGTQYPKQIRVHVDFNDAQLTEIGDAAFKNCWLANLRGARNTHIKRIGDYAFYYSQPTSDISVAGGKQSLQIDQEIEYIGEYAFAYCTTIQELKFNSDVAGATGETKKFNNLRHLGQYAFYGCNNSEFTTLDLSPCIYLENTISEETKQFDNTDTIGKYLQYTPRYAFAQCTNLQNVYLPGSKEKCTTFTRMPDRFFEGCTSLGKDGSPVWLPENINDIRPCVFNGCVYLTKVYIDGQIQYLGSSTFNNNYVLESITKSDGKSDIEFDKDNFISTRFGSNVFYGCYSLKKPVIPFVSRTDTKEKLNTNFSINSYQYYQNKSLGGMTEEEDIPFVVPFNCYSIGTYAFDHCICLKNVKFTRKPKWIEEEKKVSETETIPNVCTAIYASAFNGCSWLTKINLEDTNLAYLYGNVFYGCESLTSIKLPAREITFYNKPFDGWQPKDETGKSITATVYFHKNNTNKYNLADWKENSGWPEDFSWRKNTNVVFKLSSDKTYYTCYNNAFGGYNIRFIPYDLPNE